MAYDALDLTIQGPDQTLVLSPLASILTQTCSNLFNLELSVRGPPDMFKLFHYEALMVSQRAVHISLECCLVN